MMQGIERHGSDRDPAPKQSLFLAEAFKQPKRGVSDHNQVEYSTAVAPYVAKYCEAHVFANLNFQTAALPASDVCS